jgi:hypothetical protein
VKKGRRASQGREGPLPRVPKGRKRGDRQRGGSLTCQGSAPVKEIDGQIKGQTQGEEERWGGVRVAGSKAALKCLWLSWPNTTPQPQAPIRGWGRWLRPEPPKRAVAA